MKIYSKKQFTLLELLVAMAVFSVMMTVMMSFFSSAQKVTTSTTNRTALFSDARVALELISRDFNTIYHDSDQPLQTGSVSGGSFTGDTGVGPFSNNAVRFKSFTSNSARPGLLSNVVYYYDAEKKALKLDVDSGIGSDPVSVTVISKVADVTFETLVLGTIEYTPGFDVRKSDGTEVKLPDGVVVTIKMEASSGVAEDATRDFTKTIYLGNRGQRGVN